VTIRFDSFEDAEENLVRWAGRRVCLVLLVVIIIFDYLTRSRLQFEHSTLKMCALSRQNQVRVLEVVDDSPAKLADLQPMTDYLLGTAEIVFKSESTSHPAHTDGGRRGAGPRVV
jgi:hypothetical protein